VADGHVVAPARVGAQAQPAVLDDDVVGCRAVQGRGRVVDRQRGELPTR